MSTDPTPESIVRAREAQEQRAALRREVEQRAELLRFIQLIAVKANRRLVIDDYNAPRSHKYVFLRIPQRGEKVVWELALSVTDRGGGRWNLYFLPGGSGDFVMQRVDNPDDVRVISTRSLGRYIQKTDTLAGIISRLRSLARIPSSLIPRLRMTRGERIECWFRGI
jgi:hypothetical protein